MSARGRRSGCIAVLVVLAAASSIGCAASPKKSAAEGPQPSAQAPQAYGEQSACQDSTQRGYPSPSAPSPVSGTAPAQPQGGAGAASSRAVALQSAAREIETSQRELDVAAGDCRNACRALGSMDRAAGKVCELSQGDGDGHRCDDAKKRVYSARERVKTTCGECPGGPSVDRAAPIPSLR
jgi:hypothetical protein